MCLYNEKFLFYFIFILHKILMVSSRNEYAYVRKEKEKYIIFNEFCLSLL